MSLDIVESNIEEQIDKEHSLPKIEVKDQSMNTEINGGNLQLIPLNQKPQLRHEVIKKQILFLVVSK